MLPALMFGALSFGGSLLQGLGAKQASAKQARLQAIADDNARMENLRVLNEVNAKREEVGRQIREDLGRTDKIVEWAEKSGFNPVTFLNAGGLSHLANWADTAKYQIPEYSLTQASQVPQQHSALSAFGGALSAGVKAFATQWRADQSYELNTRKLDLAQQSMLFGLSQRPTLSNSISYGNSGGGAGFVTAARSAGGAGGLSDLPYPSKWQQGKVEYTNPSQRGFIDSNISNTDVKETRLGEPGDWLFGFDTMTHDAVRNVTGRSIRAWGEAAGMSLSQYHKGSNSYAETIGKWWNADDSLPGRYRAGFQGSVTPYEPFKGAYPSWAKP